MKDTSDYTCITAANIFYLNSFTDSCAHTACKSRKGENLDYICFIPTDRHLSIYIFLLYRYLLPVNAKIGYSTGVIWQLHLIN